MHHTVSTRRSRQGNAGIIERCDPSPAPARADEAATLSPALPPVAEGAGGGTAAEGAEDAVVAAPEAKDPRVGAAAAPTAYAARVVAADDTKAIAASASASANAAEGVDAEAAVNPAEDENHAKTKDLLFIIKKKEPLARLVAHFNPIYPADNAPSGYSKTKPYTSRLLEDRFPDQKFARFDDVKADGNCLFNSFKVHMKYEQSQGRLSLSRLSPLSLTFARLSRRKPETTSYIISSIWNIKQSPMRGTIFTQKLKMVNMAV